MSIDSARAALDLVGKTVRPAHGTERWALVGADPGVVVDVHIPDLEHPYVVCQFDHEVVHLYPFELEPLTH